MENKTKRILAVDDEPFNLDLIELAFAGISNVEIITAVNGREALDILNNNPNIDVILLDLAMPVLNGFETLKILKSNENYKNIPVLIVTANAEEKIKAFQLGANDFISKPFDVEEIKLRALNYADIKNYNDFLKNANEILEKKIEEKTRQLREALDLAKETEYEIALRLGKASEYRDIETGMHIVRISYFSRKLAELMGLPPKEQELIFRASPLHDVGKIGIPDDILLKPGKLTEKEFEIMKTHTIIGGKVLADSEKYPVINAGRIIALQHHEKWDGSGYPKGLKEEEIHIYSRIVAIADVFDALTSKRIYKPAFSFEKTVNIMKASRGKHFDPDLLDLFIGNIDTFIEIKQQFPDTETRSHLIDVLKLLEIKGR